MSNNGNIPHAGHMAYYTRENNYSTCSNIRKMLGENAASRNMNENLQTCVHICMYVFVYIIFIKLTNKQN